MTEQHLPHSVKPFHFRKYSTLPLKTLRRIIFSTTNSWTTAVSSVFLCLAVCFFLILPWTRSKRNDSQTALLASHSRTHYIYMYIKQKQKVFVLLKLDIHVRNKDLHPPVAGICAERATWQWVCALQTMIRAQRSTCCFFREHNILFQSQTQHITTHTHVYGSVRQFIWESTVPSAAWKHVRRRDAHNNMHVRSRCLLSLCGQPAAVLLCSVWSLSLETTCTARRRRCFARKNVSLGVFTRAKQLFMNELKLKMAVDARRKWLPREKVMPGKPGGDDGDAHTADQSESSPLVRPPPV